MSEATTEDILARLREEVERIDMSLVDLLAARMLFVREIAAVKAAAGMEVFQSNVEEARLRVVLALSEEAELRPMYVSGIFSLIFRESRLEQLRKIAALKAAAKKEGDSPSA